MEPHILLIDDEPSHLMLAKRALLQTWPKIYFDEASSVDEALRIIDAHLKPFTIAVIDLNLGKESGLDVLKYLRQKYPLNVLPVVLASTSELTGDVRSCYAAGANCFIVKSSDPTKYREDIVSAVKFFLHCN